MRSSLFAVSLLFAVACSSSPVTPSPEDTADAAAATTATDAGDAGTVEAQCLALFDAYCARGVECGLVDDKAACVAKHDSLVHCGQEVVGFSSNYEACVADIPKVECSAWEDGPASCRGVVVQRVYD